MIDIWSHIFNLPELIFAIDTSINIITTIITLLLSLLLFSQSFVNYIHSLPHRTILPSFIFKIKYYYYTIIPSNLLYIVIQSSVICWRVGHTKYMFLLRAIHLTIQFELQMLFLIKTTQMESS